MNWILQLVIAIIIIIIGPLLYIILSIVITELIHRVKEKIIISKFLKISLHKILKIKTSASEKTLKILKQVKSIELSKYLRSLIYELSKFKFFKLCEIRILRIFENSIQISFTLLSKKIQNFKVIIELCVSLKNFENIDEYYVDFTIFYKKKDIKLTSFTLVPTKILNTKGIRYINFVKYEKFLDYLKHILLTYDNLQKFINEITKISLIDYKKFINYVNNILKCKVKEKQVNNFKILKVTSRNVVENVYCYLISNFEIKSTFINPYSTDYYILDSCLIKQEISLNNCKLCCYEINILERFGELIINEVNKELIKKFIDFINELHEILKTFNLKTLKLMKYFELLNE